MIIKSPSRRVSQLDLKFLDIRFLSVDQGINSQTTPLQRQNNSLIEDNKSNNELLNASGRQSLHTILPHGSLIKFNKQSISRADQYTNDVTDNFAHSVLGNNTDINTENVLRYLSVDSDAIYREFGNRAPQLSTQKKKKINQKTSSKADDAIDNEIRRYERQIRNYQKENQMIHQEIAKIYATETKQKRLQVKNIRNMKIFEQTQLPRIQENQSLQQYYAQISQNYRYESEDKKIQKMKKGFFDKFKVTALSPNQITQKSQREKKQEKQKYPQNVRYRSNSNGPKNYQGLRGNEKDCIKNQLNTLPKIVKNKYEKFYEELYQKKKDKAPEEQREQEKEEKQNQESEVLEELKKKMISNNFDKNFEAFLQERKIRVPQFLKAFR